MNGKFIVIEGLDGCGKTTQTELLAETLRAEGRRVYVTREPTDSDCGKLLRAVLGGKVAADNYEMTVLFSADRLWHNLSAGGIRERLADGETVICDRYYYSTLAYQGLDGNLGDCIRMNPGCENITKPDVCVFLEADADVCLGRITANRSADQIEIFENKTALEGIRKRFNTVFEQLGDTENIVRVDAGGTVEEVRRAVYEAVSGVI